MQAYKIRWRIYVVTPAVCGGPKFPLDKISACWYFGEIKFLCSTIFERWICEIKPPCGKISTKRNFYETIFLRGQLLIPIFLYFIPYYKTFCLPNRSKCRTESNWSFDSFTCLASGLSLLTLCVMANSTVNDIFFPKRKNLNSENFSYANCTYYYFYYLNDYTVHLLPLA